MSQILKEFTENQEQVKKFIKLYKNGTPIRQLAEIFNVPKRRVYWYKEKLNLKTTPRWKQRGLPEKISTQAEMLLRGTLLGDASIRKKYKSATYEFSVTHGSKQTKYLQWKHRQLHELKPQKIGSNGDRYNSQRFSISHHPLIQSLHNEYYQPHKKITEELLYHLDPLAIAIWFMDDGSAFSHGYSLATCSFSLQENYLIKEYFKEKYNTESKVTNYNYPRIVFQKEASDFFKEIISSYILPSMKYKLFRTGIDKEKL